MMSKANMSKYRDPAYSYCIKLIHLLTPPSKFPASQSVSLEIRIAFLIAFFGEITYEPLGNSCCFTHFIYFNVLA